MVNWSLNVAYTSRSAVNRHVVYAFLCLNHCHFLFVVLNDACLKGKGSGSNAYELWSCLQMKCNNVIVTCLCSAWTTRHDFEFELFAPGTQKNCTHVYYVKHVFK